MSRPFCKDCKWGAPDVFTPFGMTWCEGRCYAPQNIAGRDLVTGCRIWRFDSCSAARIDMSAGAQCGKAGEWFTPRPQPSLTRLILGLIFPSPTIGPKDSDYDA